MDHSGVEPASRLLYELLTTVPAYRGRWQAEVRRRRSGDISRAAVAEILARHLWSTGERDDPALPRDLKDRVRRALTGRGLTAETLRWFIDAFAMSEQHARTLYATLSGYPDQSGVAHTVRRPRPFARSQRHRTISLFERYRLRSDGSLRERRTMQTIVAREDGLRAFVFNREPDVLSVEVVHGGRVGEALRYGSGLHGNEILLDSPLRRGESTSVEFVTRYPPARPTTEIRRPAYGRSENIDLAVNFPPGRRPSAVWWCVWADPLDSKPVREEAETVRRGSVRRFSAYIEQTVVGFRWTW